MEPTTNTGRHAELEIKALMKGNPENPIKGMEKEIVALADAFGRSGQSGGSGPYTASLLSQLVRELCMQQPVSPLTGEDDEWEEITESKEKIFQNKRCGSIFKHEGDKCKYIEAIIFEDEEGHSFAGEVEGIFSAQGIKSFPFIPKTFYIDVVKEEAKIILPNDKNFYERKDGSRYKYKIKDWDQLIPVFEYYEQFKLS